MDTIYYWLVIAAGVAALGYGAWATSSVLAASAGNPRMQEIAAAVQEGAKAYSAAADQKPPAGDALVRDLLPVGVHAWPPEPCSPRYL